VKTRMSIGSANFYLTDYDPGTGGAVIPPDAPAIEPGGDAASSGELPTADDPGDSATGVP